jgi:hypothetical protein
MDPIGAAVALVLAASAFYRTTAEKREAFTYGLWTAASQWPTAPWSSRSTRP